MIFKTLMMASTTCGGDDWPHFSGLKMSAFPFDIFLCAINAISRLTFNPLRSSCNSEWVVQLCSFRQTKTLIEKHTDVILSV